MRPLRRNRLIWNRVSSLAAVLIAGDLLRDRAAVNRVKSIAAEERKSEPAILAESEALDKEATQSEARGDKFMQSFETPALGTTFFEIAIVLVSIGTLSKVRFFLPSGVALTAVGLAFIATGFLQGR